MLSMLIAIAWQPELRGIIVVAISVLVLIGGTYLVVGTNVGARLGILIVLAGLFGWMMIMGSIWWTYGIGLTGPVGTWKPANPITIVRDPATLSVAGIIGATASDAQSAAAQLQSEGWRLLDEADPQRGQAVAASDEILQVQAKEFAAGEYVSVAVYNRGGERWPKINETLDFVAFFHKPHYSLVEIAPVIPQRIEPGRAPSRPVIDTAQPHRYVYMLRDLGAKRQPSIFITFGSALIFFLLCWVLHRRDLALRANLAADRALTKV